MKRHADITETFTSEDWKRLGKMERDAAAQMAQIDKDFFKLWNQVKARYDRGRFALRGVDRAEFLAFQLFRFHKTGVIG